jgi:hypothetical protein
MHFSGGDLVLTGQVVKSVNPGFEPGLPRPQRGVLTARRIRHLLATTFRIQHKWTKLDLLGYSRKWFCGDTEKMIEMRLLLSSSFGDLAQMVERSLSMREALGSMPRFSTFASFSEAPQSPTPARSTRRRIRQFPRYDLGVFAKLGIGAPPLAFRHCVRVVKEVD